MPSFVKAINTIARCGEQYRAVHLAPYGLKPNQYIYILTICRTPGVSQEQLAKDIYINKSNVTRQLAQLEEGGFIRREQSNTDKRMVQVYPTQKAQDVYPAVRKIIRAWNAYLTEDMSEQELLQLMDTLEKIKTRAIAYQQNDTSKKIREGGMQ